MAKTFSKITEEFIEGKEKHNNIKPLKDTQKKQMTIYLPFSTQKILRLHRAETGENMSEYIERLVLTDKKRKG